MALRGPPHLQRFARGQEGCHGDGREGHVRQRESCRDLGYPHRNGYVSTMLLRLPYTSCGQLLHILVEKQLSVTEMDPT